MTPPSPTSLDRRPGPPVRTIAPWDAPRVTNVGVARPAVDVDPSSSSAVEWLPRSSADRRL